MANEIQDTILKGVLEGNQSRFFYLTEKAQDEYFSDEYRDLWVITQRVHDVSREIIDRATLEKVLSRSSLPIERVVKVEDLWSHLVDLPAVSEVDFKSSVTLLIEDFQRVKLGEAFTRSLEILVRGVEDEKTKQVLQGPQDALSEFRKAHAAFEHINTEILPEFDIREQHLEILSELYEANAMDRLPTGIRPFDEMTNGGIAMGEVVFVVAGTGVGKSITCTSVAQYAMTHGTNVIYFTTETLYKQIRHRIFIKHTRDPRFGAPGGVSSTSFKKHTTENPVLEEFEVRAVEAAAADFNDNPEYGRMIVVQIPKGTPMSTVEAKLYRWQQECEIGLCIIDSPDMLAPDFRYAEERHNLNDVVNAVKGLAISFNGAKGLRILAPWQASRKGQEEAEETGRYTKRALSDTAMAEKRADIIVALLEDPDNPGHLKGQTLKNRDSASHDFLLRSDLDHYYIGSDDSLDNATDIDVFRIMSD